MSRRKVARVELGITDMAGPFKERRARAADRKAAFPCQGWAASTGTGFRRTIPVGFRNVPREAGRGQSPGALMTLASDPKDRRAELAASRVG